MKKVNQSGFSAIEAIIVMVVLVVMGGAGFLVMQRQQDSKDSTQNSTQESTQDSASTVQAESARVMFDAWGVYGMHDSDMKLTVGVDGKMATISSVELEAAAPDACGYLIERYKSTEVVSSSAGFDLGVASEYFAGSGASRTFVKVGDYYYAHISPQTNCADASGSSTPAATLEKLQNAVFEGADQVLKSLKAE